MTDTKTRERCGARVHVMFYPDADVTCNRLKGHEGDHAGAPAPDEEGDTISTTIPVSGPSGVVAPAQEDQVGGAD